MNFVIASIFSSVLLLQLPFQFQGYVELADRYGVAIAFSMLFVWWVNRQQKQRDELERSYRTTLIGLIAEQTEHIKDLAGKQGCKYAVGYKKFDYAKKNTD